MASLRGGPGASPGPAPQHYQQPIQRIQQPQVQPHLKYERHPQPEMPPVTIDNLYGAMSHWHGGQAHKFDSQPCPECGGNQYYSRSSGVRRGPPPAPHCYNCGYNGMFDQGEPATWGAA